MTNLGPTKEENDSLIYKLATMKAELRHTQKLLEAPQKKGWWRRFWGIGSKAPVMVLVLYMMIVGAAVGKEFVISGWQRMGETGRLSYVIGYYDGMQAGSLVRELYPAKASEFFEIVRSWSFGQQIAIIDKYLKDNPDKWDTTFTVLVLRAYEDACAKRGFELRE